MLTVAFSHFGFRMRVAAFITQANGPIKSSLQLISSSTTSARDPQNDSTDQSSCDSFLLVSR